MESTQRRLSVLMLPWLAHGHISPYLALANKLTARNFHIHLCSTPANLESIKKKLSAEYSNSIRLMELHLPCLPQLPAHYHTTNGLPQHLMATLKQALDMSAPTVSKMLETLKPDLLIYDFIIYTWVPTLAKSYGIPSIEFVSLNASFISFYFHFCGDFPDSTKDYPFPEIYLTSYERIGFEKSKKRENGILNGCTKASNKIVLLKTFRQIEGKYLDYLEGSMGKRMIPTGPLVEDPPEGNEEDSQSCDEFKGWLDRKTPLSTVFVSFGSEYYSSKEELEEIAIGLELSKVNFIWVIRFPSGESNDIYKSLPNGFLVRVRGRGLVVEGWAPQMTILRHPSIGGFVSHCGASSVMESLKLGVPIIAMPMHLDQPITARLLKSQGLAVEVQRNEEGRYRKEEIATVIKKVMLEEDGRDLRRNAQEMSYLMLNKGDEEIDGVVKELLHVCKEAKTFSPNL